MTKTKFQSLWKTASESVNSEMLTQPQNVIEWRYERFTTMGFADLSFALALSNIDLHRMQDLLDAGCDPAIAIECLRDEELWVGVEEQ